MKGKLLRRTILSLIAAGFVLAACNSTTTNNPGPTTAFTVLRLSPTNGALDTAGFGAGKGFVTTHIDPSLFEFALAAAVQPADDSIVVGGSSGLAGQGQIALVRYTQNGSLDTTGFGPVGAGFAGFVRTPTPAGWTSAMVSAITLQPDNKIVVAALAFNSSTNTTGIVVLRYNQDGTPDTTFNNANTPGFVIATLGPGFATDTCALALQGAKILVAGASSNGNLVLSRFNADGTPDTTFGTSGTATTLVGSQATSPALAFQSTGAIIVASGNGADHVIARYSANGALDPTFNPTGNPPGVIVTNVGGVDFANAVAVQVDDKIVVAGHARVDFTLNTSDISLIRYKPDGTLDTSFGPISTPGVVITDLGNFDNAFSVALQSPSATTTPILVSGNTGSGGISQAVVLRYTTDGTPDATFGMGGLVVVPILGPSNIASGNVVMLQSALGIVVTGYD